MKKVFVVLVLISQLSIVAQDYKFGKVSKEELEEKFYPLDSTADAAYLYRDRRTYYEFTSLGDWQLITEISERIKIYTKDGFDMATKSIYTYNPESGGSPDKVNSIKGYTFNMEGGKVIKEKLSKNSVFKERRNKYRVVNKIVMPSVKEGTVLELKYKIISPRIGYIDDVKYQFGIPIKKLDYSIEIPEFFVFNQRSKGYYNVLMERTSKSFVINNSAETFNAEVYNFKGQNVPALKANEPYIGSVRNYRGGVSFELTQTNFLAVGGGIKTYSNSWANVSKQIYQLPSFGVQLEKHSYYKDDLIPLVAQAKNEYEKVGLIFQFVKNKMKWNGFYGFGTEKGVRKAYKEQVGNVGDINLMLTSMLRYAGLNANPVLVSSKGNGVPLFPTIDGFDYVVANVQFPDNTYVLLDATEPYSTPNLLPRRALNWNGRKITENGSSSWVKLTSSKPAIEENTVMVKITDDMTVEGLYRTKYDNLNALNFRKNTNHIKEESLITSFEESKNIEIEDFKILNQKNIGKPITRNVKFISEDLVESINGKLYVEPLLFLSHHENPFKLKERKFPVDFTSPWRDRNTVSIQIPKGYKVESLPESMAIGLPDNMGVFKYQVSQNGNNINAVCIIQFKQAIIAPQYYSALKEFYAQMVKKESEKIVLVKI